MGWQWKPWKHSPWLFHAQFLWFCGFPFLSFSSSLRKGAASRSEAYAALSQPWSEAQQILRAGRMLRCLAGIRVASACSAWLFMDGELGSAVSVPVVVPAARRDSFLLQPGALEVAWSQGWDSSDVTSPTLMGTCSEAEHACVAQFAQVGTHMLEDLASHDAWRSGLGELAPGVIGSAKVEGQVLLQN